MPLTALLKKKSKFIWGPEQDKGLQALKQALASEKTLIKPNFDKEFFLQTDASDLAVSAILAQIDGEGYLRPIQYWSKQLRGSELNYPASEKEAYAVYLAFKKFNSYLLLNKTNVITDASVLKAFYGSKDISSRRVLRWAIYVGQFHHTISHIRGQDHDLADLCSRCVQYPPSHIRTMVAMMENTPGNLPPIKADLIEKYQPSEEPWCSILSCYKTGKKFPTISEQRPDSKREYQLNDQGLLCIKGQDNFGTFLRVIIPKMLIPLVLFWNHDSKSANHQGFDRTLHSVQQDYFWPTMIKDTELYVRSCIKCQLAKANTPYLNTYFHPLKMIPENPGEILCMDIAHMPRSAEGYQYLLVIVDLFSRLIEACPLRDMTANEITKAITSHCCLHGFPTSVYTDNAGAFKKALSDDCSHLLNIRHSVCIPWRHCSNISERYIRMIKEGIKIVTPQNKLGWWVRYIKFVV